MTDRELLELLLQKVTGIENDLSTMKADISNIEGQTRENTDFIKALLHRTEELSAQNHNIGATINKIEGKIVNVDEILEVVHTDLSYVVEKTAQHDRNFIKLCQVAK